MHQKMAKKFLPIINCKRQRLEMYLEVCTVIWNQYRHKSCKQTRPNSVDHITPGVCQLKYVKLKQEFYLKILYCICKQTYHWTFSLKWVHISTSIFLQTSIKRRNRLKTYAELIKSSKLFQFLSKYLTFVQKISKVSHRIIGSFRLKHKF